MSGPIRGKGEFVTGGGLYGYDISAGRAGADGTRLKFSLKTDERPLTLEAEGLLAFEAATPRFDGTLTLSRPAGAVLASGKAVVFEPWRLTSKVKADVSLATLDEVAFQYGPDERAVTLAGSGEFKFGAQPQLQGMLSARQVDLDRLLATPDAPRRLPLAAVQAFGEMLGSALRPPWPVKLALNVDTMTLGGAPMQNVASDLRSDGTTWTPGPARASRARVHPGEGRWASLSAGQGARLRRRRQRQLQRSQEPGGLACRASHHGGAVQALARQG